MTERQQDRVAIGITVVATIIVVMIIVAFVISKRFSDEKVVLKSEIAEWEVCVTKRNTEPNESITALPVVPVFTDLIQQSLMGVVHLQAPSWQGSGFVVGPRLIVTAQHCVDGVENFVLTTHDGHKFRATRAISSKEYDVAFIWVDDLTCIAEERGTLAHDVILHSLLLGSIKDCVLGQSVYVIGSPYGKMNFNSLTKGIISGVNRNWDTVDPYTGDTYGWKIAFTVDSAGHPGNSGGPVFTNDGVVRGILVAGYSPVLIGVIPCDLFLGDLESIRLMFLLDRYRREEVPVYDAYDAYDEWHNYFEQIH